MTPSTATRKDWSDEIARFETTRARKKTFTAKNPNCAQVTRHRLIERYDTNVKITTVGNTIIFQK